MQAHKKHLATITWKSRSAAISITSNQQQLPCMCLLTAMVDRKECLQLVAAFSLFSQKCRGLTGMVVAGHACLSKVIMSRAGSHECPAWVAVLLPINLEMPLCCLSVIEHRLQGKCSWCLGASRLHHLLRHELCSQQVGLLPGLPKSRPPVLRGMYTDGPLLPDDGRLRAAVISPNTTNGKPLHLMERQKELCCGRQRGSRSILKVGMGNRRSAGAQHQCHWKPWRKSRQLR